MTDIYPWDATVVAVEDQASCDMAGEMLILNLKNGRYYGLDPVGSWIWNLIQQPHTLAEVRDAIVAEYEVEQERVENDLQALLRDLATHGLIEVESASNL